MANKTLSFMRDKKNDEELEALEEQAKKQSENALQEEKDKDENLNSEEKTFKKRYSDLRRFQQKQHDEALEREKNLKKELDSLKDQLDVAMKKQIKFPSTEEEFEEWEEKYPKVAAMMKVVAMKESQKLSEDYDRKFKSLEEKELEINKRKAYNDLLKYHPDFEDIVHTEEFEDWISEQPKWVYDALYENETDARSAARAVDLYKADMSVTTKKEEKKADRPNAAADVRTPRNLEAPANGQIKWTESMLKNWKGTGKPIPQKEYEKYEEEIDEASLYPEFYDISGGAR